MLDFELYKLIKKFRKKFDFCPPFSIVLEHCTGGIRWTPPCRNILVLIFISILSLLGKSIETNFCTYSALKHLERLTKVDLKLPYNPKDRSKNNFQQGTKFLAKLW